MVHMKGDTMFFEKDAGDGKGGGTGGDAGNEPQHTEVELLAMQMGWNPEHDVNSGREFKTADKFILDSKEIQNTTVKTLHSLKRTNEDLVTGMQHLQDTHKRSAKIEKNRLEGQIAQLKADKDAAVADADVPKVKEIDAKIETAKTEIAEADQATQKPVAKSDADFKTQSEQWISENTWYGQNDVMTKYVDAQSERFRGLPPDMYFKRLTEMAKVTFPQNFEGDVNADAGQTTQQKTAQTVVGGQTRQTGAGQQKTYTFDDLSGDQKKMAIFFERNKVMKRQEYVNEQVKIGNIGK